MGVTRKVEGPRTLAEAYALAAERGALRPWTKDADPVAGFGVLDLRDSAAGSPEPPGEAWPVVELDEAPPPDPPRADRRARGANLAIAAGIVLVGIAAWNLGRDDPVPAAGTPAAETQTTPETRATTTVASTTSTSQAPSTTVTIAPATTVPTGRATTATTRRPATTAPPRSSPATTPTTAAAPSTTATTEPPGPTSTTAPPDPTTTTTVEPDPQP